MFASRRSEIVTVAAIEIFSTLGVALDHFVDFRVIPASRQAKWPCVPTRCETCRSRCRWKHLDQDWAKSLPREVIGSIGEMESETQNGNSG